MATHRPVKTYALVSGGNDSVTMLHLARGHIDGVVHLNTGIGVPQTNEWVRWLCRQWRLPLVELRPLRLAERAAECQRRGQPPPSVGDTYEEIVLTWGFPGPAGHALTYQRLKERQLRRLTRWVVGDGRRSRQRILLLGGMRRAESRRRFRTATEIDRDGARVFCSPIVGWSGEELLRYRRAHRDELPRNPVADHLHRSGECYCGAFAQEGELEWTERFYPQVAARIRRLEARVQAAGIPACRWGQRPPATPATPSPGLLCSSCVSVEPAPAAPSAIQADTDQMCLPQRTPLAPAGVAIRTTISPSPASAGWRTGLLPSSQRGDLDP